MIYFLFLVSMLVGSTQGKAVHGDDWSGFPFESQELSESCGVSRVTESDFETGILGGRDVPNGKKWPWMVSLQIDEGHQCGGALIHPKWVLSAAHCFVKDVCTSGVWTVVLGSLDLDKDEPHRETRNIVNCYTKDFFLRRWRNFTMLNDIILLELDIPVELNDYIRPVCLPRGDGTPLTNCYMTGWGYRRVRYRYVARGHLQEQRAYLISDADCYAEWKKARSSIMGPHSICLEGPDRARICKGDSGGPLLCQQGSKNWVAAGVASWSKSRCTKTRFPFAYANVTQYLDWINEKCQDCF